MRSYRLRYAPDAPKGALRIVPWSIRACRPLRMAHSSLLIQSSGRLDGLAPHSRTSQVVSCVCSFREHPDNELALRCPTRIVAKRNPDPIETRPSSLSPDPWRNSRRMPMQLPRIGTQTEEGWENPRGGYARFLGDAANQRLGPTAELVHRIRHDVTQVSLE